MPYDSHGNFSRLHNWEQDRQNDIEIMSDRHDEEDNNFAEGFNECFLRDGRVAMSGNLNIGNYQIKNVARATVGSDAVNLAQVNDIKNEAVQDYKDIVLSLFDIGDIKPSLQNANHGNWLLCNGQAVSRESYADLFELIGTSFGGGDGVNTFNVPDYRGKFLRGLGGNSAANFYTTQPEGLPNITGTIDVPDDRSQGYSGAFYKNGSTSPNCTDSGDGNTQASFDASLSNPIYGASEHVTPINQAVNWFIKAKGE